ncbi:Dcp1-like decapping family [Geosmithia morbida]|uniref:Dcp1-like decapping family n=1 Tax=Geosmithia morbida TaxID=1094350 RepID=A0A9P4YVT1_9HYPO|nr:Dcp1-like decapping family [Geosmithia morbida]KAF4121934.1 Dcp1-like decapping family [Geosmithia morbida]
MSSGNKNVSRKSRHTRQPSNRIPAVSDYESDAAAMQSTHDYAPPPPTRTNTELNLSVLQRYIPSVATILKVAANAVLYTFDATGQRWDKSGVEGTMFVCLQNPLLEDPQRHPRGCVFVLNRRGLGNVMIELNTVDHTETMGELFIMRVDADVPGLPGKVVGLWVHNDKASTRQEINSTITETWKMVRSFGQPQVPSGEYGPAMQAIGGGVISLDDLFRSQASANAGH